MHNISELDRNITFWERQRQQSRPGRKIAFHPPVYSFPPDITLHILRFFELPLYEPLYRKEPPNLVHIFYGFFMRDPLRHIYICFPNVIMAKDLHERKDIRAQQMVPIDPTLWVSPQIKCLDLSNNYSSINFTNMHKLKSLEDLNIGKHLLNMLTVSQITPRLNKMICKIYWPRKINYNRYIY
jgi:hypothetical protein